MTFHIKLSELEMTAEEFAARVKAHFERLVEYYLHLDGVRADAANPDLKAEDKRVAFPGPSEIDKVELAIYRDRHDDGRITPVIDYQIDGPTLDEKKAALAAEVRAKETAATHAVMPPAKVRHWHFREQDIRAADHARLRANQPPDPNAFLTETRPAEDTQFLRDHAARLERAGAIQRWAAKHEHDIHDLNEDNVDSFKVGGEFA